MKKYYEAPFIFISNLVLYFQFIIVYMNSEKWDYVYHNLFSKWILVHEIEADELLMNGFDMSTTAYPIYHLFVKIIHLLLRVDYSLATAYTICIFNLVFILAVRQLLIYIMNGEKSYLLDFITIASIVIYPVYGYLTNWNYYATITSMNPIHNPTVIAVRPFAILTILFYLKAREKEKLLKNIILFGLFLLLSCFAKPSFAVVFLPIFMVELGFEYLQKKDIKAAIKLFMAIVPSVITLFAQRAILLKNAYGLLSTNIAFGGFSHLTGADVFKFTVAFIAIPIILFSINSLKDTYYRLAWEMYIIAWIEMYFLDNGPTGDFSWGYGVATLIIIMISAINALKRKENKYMKLRGCLALICLLYQFGVGVQFLRLVYFGGNYWI